MSDRKIMSYVFLNLAGFLWVRFIVLGTSADGNYANPLILLFLTPLVLISLTILIMYTLIYRIRFSLQLVITHFLQLLITVYSIWLFICFGTAVDFPTNKSIEKNVNAELPKLVWSSKESNIIPSSLILSCESSKQNDVIIIKDREFLSTYHWRIPQCRRASSISDTRYAISISETTRPHPSAEWILESPDGTSTSMGPVMVPIWIVEVLDIEMNNIFSIEFEGSLSGASTVIQNISETTERLNVTKSPVDDFLSYFGLPKSQWEEFFYPEKRILRILGIL